MEVLIENLQNKIEVTEDFYGILNKAIDLSLELEGFTIPSEISVILVDNEMIREINNEHRKIDKATDVLSFPMADIYEGKLNENEGDYDRDENLLLLGDIVISMEMVEKQAQEYGHSFERELAFLTTHGVFHLLGYDHMDDEQEKRMLGKQEDVLAKMGLMRQL
ncbi:MAG: rRNA maturation RNase YbeY [Clostridia bacterium]|nr:rRNA maturation RNase YbeY [Clostridia bacterium]